MSAFRLLATPLLLLAASCAVPQQTVDYGPPSLRVAPPSYYSRTPYYKRTVIPAVPARGNRKGRPETVIIEREVVPVYDGGSGKSEREVEKADQRIDAAQDSVRDMQSQLREKYREMSPEVNQDGPNRR